MYFVKPNALHRTGLSVGEDHGLAEKLIMGLIDSSRIADARTFAIVMGDLEAD